jgi:hypothetical protein
MSYTDFFCEVDFPHIPQEGRIIESDSYRIKAKIRDVAWDIDTQQYKIYLEESLLGPDILGEVVEMYENAGWTKVLR